MLEKFELFLVDSSSFRNKSKTKYWWRLTSNEVPIPNHGRRMLNLLWRIEGVAVRLEIDISLLVFGR